MGMTSLVEGTKNNHGKADFYGYRFIGEWYDWATRRWEPSEINTGDGYTSEEAVMWQANHCREEWDKMSAIHTDWRNERMILYRYSVEMVMEVELDKEETI